VVSLNKNNLRVLGEIAEKHSIPYHVLGSVGGERFTVQYKGKDNNRSSSGEIE